MVIRGEKFLLAVIIISFLSSVCRPFMTDILQPTSGTQCGEIPKIPGKAAGYKTWGCAESNYRLKFVELIHTIKQYDSFDFNEPRNVGC